MIGYVKCSPPELKVKHYRLYQAAYCGLCHAVKTRVSRFLLPFLSYDFVFLALCRMLTEKDEIKTERMVCLFHPFSARKVRMKTNASLVYAARAGLCFTVEKMRDDRLDGDAPFFRRVLIFLYLPVLRLALRRTIKQDPSFGDLYQTMRGKMEELRAAEQRKASPDEVCLPFADCLALVFSFGLTGDKARVFHEIGAHLGDMIYTLDALDDREKDAARGAFNPFLQDGAPDRARLCEIDMVQSFHIQCMLDAAKSLGGDENLQAIIQNIIGAGLAEAQRRVLKLETGEDL